MKNETLKPAKEKGKAAMEVAVLPWWAAKILAKHSRELGPVAYSLHYHHCCGCDRVIICQSKECTSSVMLCSVCTKKSKNPSQGGN